MVLPRFTAPQFAKGVPIAPLHHSTSPGRRQGGADLRVIVVEPCTHGANLGGESMVPGNNHKNYGFYHKHMDDPFI